MRRMHRSRSLASFLALLLLSGTTLQASQAPERRPLGALRATGEVYVNDSRVTGESTVFIGDALRTGADGAARLTVSGRGSLIASSQTRLVFQADPRYFATLQQGSVGLRSLTAAKNFQLRVGSFAVVPDPAAEAAAEVELAADGSARINCTEGSVGVIELEGSQSLFCHAGEVATISPEGTLQTGAPRAPTPAAPAPTAPAPEAGKAKKSPTGLYVLLGLAGAGAAGAAAGLAGRGGAAPVSPSGP
jgi:hypothetical protein